jgi:hypothetical protein
MCFTYCFHTLHLYVFCQGDRVWDEAIVQHMHMLEAVQSQLQEQSYSSGRASSLAGKLQAALSTVTATLTNLGQAQQLAGLMAGPRASRPKAPAATVTATAAATGKGSAPLGGKLTPRATGAAVRPPGLPPFQNVGSPYPTVGYQNRAVVCATGSIAKMVWAIASARYPSLELAQNRVEQIAQNLRFQANQFDGRLAGQITLAALAFEVRGHF